MKKDAGMTNLEERINQRKAEARKKALFEKVEKITTILGKYKENTSHDDGIPIYRREGWMFQEAGLRLVYRRQGYLEDSEHFQKNDDNRSAEVSFEGKGVFYEVQGFPVEPGDKIGVIGYIPGSWEAQLENTYNKALEQAKQNKQDKKAKEQADAAITAEKLAKVASENFGIHY
jgi:hypothetical protein